MILRYLWVGLGVPRSLPDALVEKLAGAPSAALLNLQVEPINHRTCAASGSLAYLRLEFGHPGADRAEVRIIRRILRPDFDISLDREWLARDQLGQRLGEGHLDWTGLPGDPQVVELWQRRWELLERLRRLPVARFHGDYSIGNLVAQGPDAVASTLVGSFSTMSARCPPASPRGLPRIRPRDSEETLTRTGTSSRCRLPADIGTLPSRPHADRECR